MGLPVNAPAWAYCLSVSSWRCVRLLLTTASPGVLGLPRCCCVERGLRHLSLSSLSQVVIPVTIGSCLMSAMSAMSDNVLRECRYGLYVQVHNYVDMIVCLLVA